MPLIVGGASFRSAQFGVYETMLHIGEDKIGKSYGDEHRILGLVNPLVVGAGFCGGVARGLVEGPFEYIKTRRQVCL